MGLTALLSRFAARGPATVYPVAGRGARSAVQDLRLIGGLRLTETPRAASVLLIAGALPDESSEALARTHDALAHPRATVWWPLGAGASGALSQFPDLTVVTNDVEIAIREVYRSLLHGERPSEAAILPDEDPAPWRGIGPFGQGGSGMTGGVPYGRPMAGLVDDRDGLRLDVLPVTIGPFSSALRSGLTLELTMGGDVIVEVAAARNLLATVDRGRVRPGLTDFERALTEPVPIATLELARAREHLRWLADALVMHGLPALGLRALRLAHRVRLGDAPEVQQFARRLAWTQVFRWSLAGVGRIEGEQLTGLDAGPVARASGLAIDARLDDPAYQALGFEPIVHEGGDAAARWRQRLAEAAQSLQLADRAGDQRTERTGAVESPGGRLDATSAPSARLLELVPDLITGLEWGDAITTLVSLDLDLDEPVAVATDAPLVVAG